MSRNEGRFEAAEGIPTPEDEGSSAAAVSPPTQFNWAVPTEIVELPSKGRFYPEGHVLHNTDTVELRYMTAKEEDILTDRTLLRKGLAVDRALSNLLVYKSIKLLEFDLIFKLKLFVKRGINKKGCGIKSILAILFVKVSLNVF